MLKKLVIVDLTFFHIDNYNDYTSLLSNHASSFGHHKFLAQKTNLHVIRFLNQEHCVNISGVNYNFLRGKSTKLWLPFKIVRFVKALQPDTVILHGFHSPLQNLVLALQLRAPIVIQYHGGGEPKGKRGFLQKILKHFVKDYIFTAKEQASDFIKQSLITRQSHIHEILEGSTNKKAIDKKLAKKELGIADKKTVFLWVGRLIENKDPITVLKGISDYLSENQTAIFLLIYHDKTLVQEIQYILAKNEVLNERVKLIGEVEHNKLDIYYSAANYYVSGSFYEGSGYALFEAMACGCVPLVTDIPSFRMITNNGTIGELWQAGNQKSLKESLKLLLTKNYEEESLKAINYFNSTLSFEAIANKHLEMVKNVMNSKKQ